MSRKKENRHIQSLETLVDAYKNAYYRYVEGHRQISRILVTEKESQEKIFDVLNIIRNVDIEDAIELGKRLGG